MSRQSFGPNVGDRNEEVAMTRRWRIGLVTVVAALGGATAIAVAAVPDGNGEIHACLDVTTTTGGVIVPKQNGSNLTVIDPAAGQKCIPPDGPAVPNQTEISWSVTDPQGPPDTAGAPGAAGASGPAGPAGATGSAGAASSGVTNSVTIAPPLLNANAKSVGDVTIGSGSAALTFSILAAEQAGAAARQPAAGKTTFHDFSFTKKLDKASPSLSGLAASGKHLPKVTIEYAKPSAAGKYLEIILSDVLISSDQTQASAGDKPSPRETINLNFGKIKWTYTQQKPTGPAE
jgi:type VI secretion system Hcp family effector